MYPLLLPTARTFPFKDEAVAHLSALPRETGLLSHEPPPLIEMIRRSPVHTVSSVTEAISFCPSEEDDRESQLGVPVKLPHPEPTQFSA